MFRRSPRRLALIAAALAAAFALPASGQVWEPGDPPRETAGAHGIDTETDGLTVPDAPPDTTAAPAQTRAADPAPMDDASDFLCARAPEGKTSPVPAPFDGWLVRVCAPQGQALVPVLGEAWVAHGSADPVSILAMPPGAVPPPSAGAFDARYDIRFDAFEGGKMEGERLTRAAALIETASGGSEVPPYDAAWQLDAVSNVGGIRYNLFFYVKGERPDRIIACLDQCRQALYLDVLRGAEAKEVLGR
ncbi:MAG: hypothetical protein CVT81_02755 [Alphaproteobacteria bacterium HGW-Alphaproteobacteria-3]|jgi:hypothetical protein|nr:MAG: hypothetical protein CVT81_02755 [Alphaproteobacteria bacterium HGW-Alphaproteobacteria-3]